MEKAWNELVNDAPPEVKGIIEKGGVLIEVLKVAHDMGYKSAIMNVMRHLMSIGDEINKVEEIKKSKDK